MAVGRREHASGRVAMRGGVGRRRRVRQPYSWLGVGALTVGVGIALAPGCGVAHADVAGGPSAADSQGTVNHTPGATRATSGGFRGDRVGGRRTSVLTASTLDGGTGGGASGAVARHPRPVAATLSRPTAVSGSASGSGSDVARAGAGPDPAAVVRRVAGGTRVAGNASARVAFAAPPVSVTVADGVPVVTTSVENHSARAAFMVPAASLTVTTAPARASSIGQQITVAVNTAFNALFTGLGGLPANPISGLLEGALVLVRRTVFGLVPTGVTAAVIGSTLVIDVDPGSIAYFRQNGTSLQVSGDPVFFHLFNAQQFDAASVQTVTATGTGNAGLVFSSGDVNASLETTGIDSLNFGAGAQFAGSVDTTLDSGTLVLYKAVRGKTGVTLDAPAIRLATKVDVEAASLTGTAPDVTFTGTVDATTAGAQSLTVTALGTTTFEAAVGSQVALGSLLTRGITPLEIAPSSGAQSIPLNYYPLIARYGIDVAIGDNAAKPYLFDTGSGALVAGYNPGWWRGVPPVGPGPVSTGYEGGDGFKGSAVTTPVTIGGGKRTLTTRPLQLLAALGPPTYNFSNPYVGPVEGVGWYGVFGAGFSEVPVPGQTPDQQLANALFQLPGSLSNNGYLVQLGPLGTPAQLTVGLPPTLHEQFPYAVDVSQAVGPPEPGNYPVIDTPQLFDWGISATYSVAYPDGTTYHLNDGNPLPTIFDTGVYTTTLFVLPRDVPVPHPDGCTAFCPLPAGATFTAKFPGATGHPDLTWSFQTGHNTSVDQIVYQTVPNFPNVATALNMFNDFSVLFDAPSGLVYLRPNGGQSTVDLQSVTTTGAQSYQQGNAVLDGTYSTGGGTFSAAGSTTLVGTTQVEAGHGAVTFSGTVDGAAAGPALALTVSTTAATTFVRPVGGITALNSLTTAGGGLTSTASVTTDSSQSYSGDLILNGLYLVNDSSGSFRVDGATTVTGPNLSYNATIVQTNGGDITFDGTVDATPHTGFPLTLSAGTGNISLQGAVGSINPLGGLVIINAGTVTAQGAVSLDGSLGYSLGEGLQIGGADGTGNVGTANFTGGGSIIGFQTEGGTPNGTCGDQRVGACGSGIVVNGTPSGSITGFTIGNNASWGIYSIPPLSLIQTGNQFIGNAGPDVGPFTAQ